MSEPVVKTYRGVQFVVADKNGQFEGVAWSTGRKGSPLAREYGSSQSEVFEKLRLKVESPETREELRQALITKHAEFLLKHGIDPSHLKLESIKSATRSLHRATHCWSCRTSIDNETDLECSGCSWIICTACGACGHGHPQYGVNYMASAKYGAGGTMELKQFESYQLALEFAREEPGARVRKNNAGSGWFVEVRGL